MHQWLNVYNVKQTYATLDHYIPYTIKADESSSYHEKEA